VKIVAAQGHQAPAISALALRSKAHWGYDQAFMQQVKDELTYQPKDLLNNPTFVATEDEQLLGFYQLIRLDGQRAELEALFVDPAHLGQGIGQRLFEHMAQHCVELGFSAVEIQSDPFAKGFYLHMGCVQTGSRPAASISGRELPLLSYQVTPAAG
jgi:GNAT superfamily N-acetyltransferase